MSPGDLSECQNCSQVRQDSASHFLRQLDELEDGGDSVWDGGRLEAAQPGVVGEDLLDGEVSVEGERLGHPANLLPPHRHHRALGRPQLSQQDLQSQPCSLHPGLSSHLGKGGLPTPAGSEEAVDGASW